MNNLNIGKIITTPQQRDAVHMAIAPVVAGAYLIPGMHVTIVDGEALPANDKNGIGVVDPFLKSAIGKGVKFWLLLYPGSITSLRHMWEHPSFAPDEAPKNSTQQIASKLWLENFGSRNGFSWERLMEMGNEILSGEDCPWAGDDSDQDTMNENKREFVFHAAAFLGKPPVDTENVYFRCAC